MLIICVAYQNGTKPADFPVSEISDYIGRPDAFVGVALSIIAATCAVLYGQFKRARWL